MTDDFSLYLALSFVGGTFPGASVPAMFTVLHRVCGSPRRALAVAIALLFANLLGAGFGPIITGALSDRFSATMGPVGLRYALAIAVAILLPCGVLTAGSISRDTEA